MIGKVRWFNPKKGFGFVTSGNKDYFVFYKSIDMQGFRKLENGQKVVFEVIEYKGYKQAIQVKKYNDKKSRNSD